MNECCHEKREDEACEVCDAYASLPVAERPQAGEMYDDYVVRIAASEAAN